MDFNNFVETKLHAVSVIEGLKGINVIINVLDNNNREWLLTASNTSELLLEEMRLQNIIQCISLFDKHNADSEDLRKKIFYLLRGRLPIDSSELIWNGVNDIVKSIKISEKVFLEIEAVYGTTVLLISNRVSMELRE